MKKIALFIYSICLLHSCSSEPQTSDQLFAHLSLRYLQPDNEIKSEAHFSLGNKLENAKPIKVDSGVSFQGKKMIDKEVSKDGIRYSLVQKGNFSNLYNFSFSFPEKKEIQHLLKMNSLGELNIDGDFVKSKGIQISWKGNPLTQNESLAFLFNNEENNFTSFEINGPTNSSSINIPSEKLNKLPEGKGEIYLVRKQSNTTEQSNVTILSETEFYSRVINVTILP